MITEEGRAGRGLTLALAFWKFPSAVSPAIGLSWCRFPHSGHTRQHFPPFMEETLDATPAITLTVLGKHWFLLFCFKESGSSFCVRTAAPVGRKCTQGPGGITAPWALSTHLLYIKAISGG